MNEAFHAFLEQPNRENYRQARRDIVKLPEFDHHSPQLAELIQLCSLGRLRQAELLADQMWPTWCLCPRFHLWMGHLAERMDDAEGLELAQFQFHSCMEGILATGHGSLIAPYQILRIFDEYDILQARNRSPRSQRIIWDGESWFDVVTTRDGMEFWFDFGSTIAIPDLQSLHWNGATPAFRADSTVFLT